MRSPEGLETRAEALDGQTIDRPQLRQGHRPEALGPERGHELPPTGDPDMPTVVHLGGLEPRVATPAWSQQRKGLALGRAGQGQGWAASDAGTPTSLCLRPQERSQHVAPPLAVSRQPTRGPDRPHSGPPRLVTRSCTRGDTPAPQRLQVGPRPGVPQSPPGGGDRGHGTVWVRSQTPSRSLEPQAPGTTHRLMKGSPPGTRRGPLGHRHRLWGKAAEQPSSFLRSRTLGCTCSGGRAGGRPPRPSGKE